MSINLSVQVRRKDSVSPQLPGHIMLLSLSQLERSSEVDKLVIHSLDLCLYQVSAIIAGQEYFICDDRGRLLRSHNKLDLQRRLQRVAATRTVLRQHSAYDEMVGQPPRTADNQLEVELGCPDESWSLSGERSRH